MDVTVNKYGTEIVFDPNSVQIPGITERDELMGVPVTRYNQNGQVIAQTESILDMYNQSEIKYIGSLINALNNRGKYRNDFVITKNDFTHEFKGGNQDMMIWAKSYDARKIDFNMPPEDDGMKQIWSRNVLALKSSKFTPEQIMTDSPIYYINNYGETEEYSSIWECAKHYRLHPTHIILAVENIGELTHRFVKQLEV